MTYQLIGFCIGNLIGGGFFLWRVSTLIEKVRLDIDTYMQASSQIKVIQTVRPPLEAEADFDPMPPIDWGDYLNAPNFGAYNDDYPLE